VAQARPLVTIGGLNGVAVDLTVRPDTGSLPCRFLDSEGGDVTLVDPGVPDAQLAIQSLNDTRILLLDGGDGRIMAIVIEADYMGDWETELEEAMGIVESFEFAR
jgi:hypothetical protein